MSLSIAFNLSTGEIREYTCSPKDAVIAAYAQSRGDWNTWDYQSRYSHMVEETHKTYLLGDWSVIKPLTEEENDYIDYLMDND